MDAKMAVEILRQTIFQFSPEIAGCKPISTQRAAEIADLIQQQAEQIEKMKCCGNCKHQADCITYELSGFGQNQPPYREWKMNNTKKCRATC